MFVEKTPIGSLFVSSKPKGTSLKLTQTCVPHIGQVRHSFVFIHLKETLFSLPFLSFSYLSSTPNLLRRLRSLTPRKVRPDTSGVVDCSVKRPISKRDVVLVLLGAEVPKFHLGHGLPPPTPVSTIQISSTSLLY